MKPYEILEHTADIGLRIYGPDLESLFRNAALGLADLITDLDQLVGAGLKPAPTIRLQAENLPELFLKWLREILYYFSAKKLILLNFKFQKISETELEAQASGILFDPQKHEQKYEVKAITYHGFKIEKTPAGWVAEVIVDI